MTLFIGRDDGTNTFFPGDVGASLLAISNVDGGYGEEPDNPAEPRGIEVTYNRNDTGVCAQRLDALVNTNFGVDIIIWGVGPNFLVFGFPISNFAGVALDVGETTSNPADILTAYDVSACGGNGYWVIGVSGDRVDFPSAVILYHELAHCFHFATGVASTEPLATADENDMRDQMGCEHRDVNNHNGGCGPGKACGGMVVGGNGGGGIVIDCCIVASISTGSPFSAEVNSLRKVRDHYLRNTAVGEDFFNHLHYDYYSFSPEICRMMAEDPKLTSLIRNAFVGPLVCMLDLLSDYSKSPYDYKSLGQKFEKNFLKMCDRESFDFGGLARQKAAIKDHRILGSELGGALTGFELGDLFSILESKAASSVFLRWAILDMVLIFLEIYELYTSGATAEICGESVAKSFENWAPQIPLTKVWDDLSTHSFVEELKSLEKSILKTTGAKEILARRLMQNSPEAKKRMFHQALIETGFITAKSGDAL